MPFQALPIAFRKTAGSPINKLLLIYLTLKCDLPDHPDDLRGRCSEMISFDAHDAAKFCECTVAEVFAACADLERMRLAYPDEIYLAQSKGVFARPEYRWDFLVVALPLSPTDHRERKRIKCNDDQMDLIQEADGYRCVTCGVSDNEEAGLVVSWVVDHIIPRSKGGADVEENCQTICAGCNGRKGAKLNFVDFLGGRK